MCCTLKPLWSLVCWEICIAYLCTSTATALDLDLLVMYLFQACSAFAFPPESFSPCAVVASHLCTAGHDFDWSKLKAHQLTCCQTDCHLQAQAFSTMLKSARL